MSGLAVAGCACWRSAEKMEGTLNGSNTDDPTLTVGDDDVLKCDLIPLGLAANLSGEWHAFVDGQAAEIVSINVTGGHAFVVPPTPPGHYAKPGSVVVRCVFQTPEGDVLFESNHTVTVTGELTRSQAACFQCALLPMLPIGSRVPLCICPARLFSLFVTGDPLFVPRLRSR